MIKGDLDPSRLIRDLNILYILPICDEELTSAYPFRGFTPEIVRIAPLITWVLQQPYHAVQLLMRRESLLQHRMCGTGHQIVPVHISSFAQHALVSLGYALQREDFIHSPHTGENCHSGHRAQPVRPPHKVNRSLLSRSLSPAYLRERSAPVT